MLSAAQVTQMSRLLEQALELDLEISPVSCCR
jgi:hypothetical protein